MTSKQDRYRKRKAEQGFQRVEVLVPEVLAPHLKAYARALRDTHALGTAPPLFDGMGRTGLTAHQLTKPDMAAAEQKQKVDKFGPPAPREATATPARKKAEASKSTPDFFLKSVFDNQD